MQAYKLSFVDINDKQELEKFIKSISKKFESNDTFTASEEFSIDSHYHKGFESRLFLSGHAIFTIYGEDIYCGPGTYIELKPEIVHSFKYSGGSPLSALRFFNKTDSWQAIFV